MKKAFLLLAILLTSIGAYSQKASTEKVSVGFAGYIGKKQIPVSELSKVDGLAMEINDKRVEGRILGFTLAIKGDVYYVESATGAALNDFMKEQIAALKSGAIIQFKNVKIEGKPVGVSFNYKVVK